MEPLFIILTFIIIIIASLIQQKQHYEDISEAQKRKAESYGQIEYTDIYISVK